MITWPRSALFTRPFLSTISTLPPVGSFVLDGQMAAVDQDACTILQR